MVYASFTWAGMIYIKSYLAVLLRGQLVQIAEVPLRVSIWQQCKRGEEVVLAVGETLRQCDSKALFISGVRWYFDSSLIGAGILVNESVSASYLQACFAEGSLLWMSGQIF